MAWIPLLFKDIREHALAMIALAVGFFVVVLVAILQQRMGEFSLSGFEVVRFCLITLLPLIAFIVGNRLIVREYVGGTRKFVEALPTRDFTPLLVKYCIGLFYLSSLCVLVVVLAAMSAGTAEDIDQQYILLLLTKTIAIGALIWSVVFFVSFTGRIRLIIYVVMGVALMYFINTPSFDTSRFAPFELIDRQLFVFEREIFPYRDLIETGLIALLFVLAGFGLALINEGSIAEQLGKPVSGRDMAAFALLGLGCAVVFVTLQKRWERQEYELAGAHVLRSEAPRIAVSYVDQRYQEQAEQIVASLANILTNFKTDIGLDQLPQVQISLNTDLEPTEVTIELLDGVLLAANFADYDDYEFSQLYAFAMHHVLLSLTNERWDFESQHWLLDGFARWWVEGAANAAESANNDELFALAVLAQRRSSNRENPLQLWQTLTDQLGFEATEALSYSAIVYLAQTKGVETVIELAADYVSKDVGSSSVESVKQLFDSDITRFNRITGIGLPVFTRQWQTWLKGLESEPDVASLVAAVPRIAGEISTAVDDRGVHRIQARYIELDGFVPGAAGTCVLRHQLTSAYNIETWIHNRTRDRQDCVTEAVAHNVESEYAAGDRVFGVLEFESEQFHRPIPIWAGRIDVK